MRRLAFFLNSSEQPHPGEVLFFVFGLSSYIKLIVVLYFLITIALLYLSF